MSPRKESGDVSPALQICFRGWADFCTPRTGALQIALFGGLEAPKVLASGRPLLAHVDPSTAREVDRPLRRAMLNKSRLRRHYFSIEPRTLSGLDPPSRATRIGSCIFPGQKIPQKIQKTVLHLFSSLDPGTTAFHSTLLKPLTASRLMRKSFVRFGLPFFCFLRFERERARLNSDKR